MPPTRGRGRTLLVYHRPIARWQRDASTVNEHVAAFGEHSRLPVWTVNSDEGFPPGLEAALWCHRHPLQRLGLGVGAYRLNDAWLDYLDRSGSYLIAFFQDECTVLPAAVRVPEPARGGLRLHVPGAVRVRQGLWVGTRRRCRKLVSQPARLRERARWCDAAHRFGAARRPRDRSTSAIAAGPLRRLPRAGSDGEAPRSASGFARAGRRARAGPGPRPGEGDRLYGDDWYRFLGELPLRSWESNPGSSVLRPRGRGLRRVRAADAGRGHTDIERRRPGDRCPAGRTSSTTARSARAISRPPPLRVCQVLFEGRYSGVIEADGALHPAGARTSRTSSRSLDQLRDPALRAELTENAYRDLIASGDSSYPHARWRASTPCSPTRVSAG